MHKRIRAAVIFSVFLMGLFFVSVPAFAQVDFSGEWAPLMQEDQPERAPGPEMGDYLGLPINEAARTRANNYLASLLEVPEWLCRPHMADYIWWGPSQATVTKEQDPLTREVVAFHVKWLRSIDNPIYLDGRPHPDADALHSWGGFATGKWEGDQLTVTITNLKEGEALRRNGVPRSDQATVIEHWMRYGDYWTIVIVTYDPVYLTEPMIRTTTYHLTLDQQVPPYPCEMVTEVARPKGVIPHRANFGVDPATTDLADFGKEHGIPFVVTQGGAETMYPDYRKKLKQLMGATPASGAKSTAPAGQDSDNDN